MDIEKVMRDPAVRLTIETLRLNSLLVERFTPTHAHTGLSRLELTVLIAVTAAPAAPTVPQIGRAVGHARQAVQKAANALYKAGLILTGPNPRHKQARLLMLTDAGRAVANEVFQRSEAIAQGLSDELDGNRLNRLSDELASLRSALEETEAVSMATTSC